MSKDSGKAAVIDDDEFDDLDDVLDKFTTAPPATTSSAPPPPTRTAPKPTAQTKETSSNPATSDSDAPLDDEAFAAALASGMEELMRELGRGGDNSADPAAAEAAEAVRAAFEKLMVEDLEGGENFADTLFSRQGQASSSKLTPPPSSSSVTQGSSSSTPGSKNKPQDEFQRAIRQGVDKLRESEDTLKTEETNPEDPISKLLEGLGDLGLGADGEGENVQDMLEGMMAALMSKEILYEPLKELKTKYPDYLSQHASTISSEDKARYEGQLGKVSAIVATFDKSDYSDENPVYSSEIMRLMNEMQTYGSPPAELMGDMPPGMAMGEDGMPQMPEGCMIS